MPIALASRSLRLLPFGILLVACSPVVRSLPFNGDATAFAREFQPKRIALECAKERNHELVGWGGGGGGGGGEATCDFSLEFRGDEAARAELMHAIEQRIDEAMATEGLTVTGRGQWSALPGFSRRYQSPRQRGFLYVHSAVTDGYVSVRGDLREFPR